MDGMTARELLSYLADDFHDWIDGDDSVASYKTFGDEISSNKIWVKFESGAQFVVSVEEVFE